MTSEELLIKSELHELVDRFSILEIDVPGQMELFAKDTHVQVFMGDQLAFDLHGVEELGNTFSLFTADVKRAHHMNGQFLAEVNGDTAAGTLYCTATLVTEKDGKEIVTEHRIRYNDTYSRLADGTWVIQTRSSHFLISETRELA